MKILVNDQTKESKGFGFVCFRTPDSAQKVIQASKDGKLLFQGQNLIASQFEKKDDRIRRTTEIKERMNYLHQNTPFYM